MMPRMPKRRKEITIIAGVDAIKAHERVVVLRAGLVGGDGHPGVPLLN